MIIYTVTVSGVRGCCKPGVSRVTDSLFLISGVFQVYKTILVYFSENSYGKQGFLHTPNFITLR